MPCHVQLVDLALCQKVWDAGDICMHAADDRKLAALPDADNGFYRLSYPEHIETCLP